MGRPSIFTPELADEICEFLETGGTLTAFCEKNGAPSYETIRRWLRDNEEFRAKYARAREESAHASAELIQNLAKKAETGDLDSNAARVAIDAHKWLAGKRKPKVYGDRQIVDVGDDTLKHLSPERVDARIVELLGKAGAALALGVPGKTEGGKSS